jgi:hypothetical protein
MRGVLFQQIESSCFDVDVDCLQGVDETIGVMTAGGFRLTMGFLQTTEGMPQAILKFINFDNSGEGIT